MTPLRQGYGGQALRQGYGAAGFLAVLVALALGAFAVVRGTWAVGGSDSSCYALMAQAFARGELQPASVLAVEAPWPDAARTFAPGGFIPSAIHGGAAAPICAPGMSMLMAPLAAVFGPDAIFWLTPMAAFVLVLSASAIASQLVGGMAGVTAAVLTATSPIVLFQAVQPMNDVLTAALWLAAIACGRRSLVAGVLVGLAILVRPNLAPLAIVLAMLPFMQNASRPQQLRSLGMMVAGALPGVIGMLWLNHALYGGVFATGYGEAADLFALSNIGQNASSHARAAFATHHIVPAIGLLAPWVFGGVKRKGALFLLGFVAVVLAIYLPYSPFPEWWYLRFLMPALVVLLILASAVGVHVLTTNRMGGVVPIVAVVLAVLGVRAAGDRQVFDLQRLEGRYRETSELVRDRLPPNAVLITVWQSGSMRYHAGRDVVLWDSLDPAWLDRAITWLKAKQLQPYIMVERREEPDFRARFRGRSDIGGLDFPPRFDLNRQVRIFDPDDRARYLSGEAYSTENIRPRLR
jgi:hypothetical protein